MAAVGHLGFLTFDRIALECNPSFSTNLNTLISLKQLLFAIEGHLEVKNKMAVVGHHKYLNFDIITVKSYVIPLFCLI